MYKRQRPDRADGLTNIQILGRDRYAQCDETCTADCGACKGRRFGPYALPVRTRYDAEWPSVVAAEVDPSRMAAEDAALAALPGGDLAAMAAPAFAGWGEYEIEPEAILLASALGAVAEMDECRDRTLAAVKPRGRQRQTDPLDLLLADLRDIEDRLS